MAKVILCDVSVFGHKAIFSWASQIRLKQNNPSMLVMPIGYIYFSMLIGCLKKIHVEKDDLVLMCMDGRNSWRKDVYAPYKANREELRDKTKEVNWEKAYGEIEKVNKELKISTRFEWVQLDKVEADDIIAQATDFFKDRECIIVSIDADLKMLCHRPNVKFFSLMVKHKNVKGNYVKVHNPLKILSDKVRKGDVSDNILVGEDDDNYDVQIRKEIINLLELPNFIIEKIVPELEKIVILPSDEIEFSKLPYQNSLAKKFVQIFDPQYKINYDDVITEVKKPRRKKNGLRKEKGRNSKSSNQVVDAGKEDCKV